MRLLHGHRQRPRSPFVPNAGEHGERAEITTLEGSARRKKPHPIQRAFIDEQAAQCGFCLSGVVLTAKAYLDQNPKATDVQIEQAMSNVLCRCFTTTRMMRAIRRYATERA